MNSHELSLIDSSVVDSSNASSHSLLAFVSLGKLLVEGEEHPCPRFKFF